MTDNYLLSFILESLPGLILGVLLAGYLFAIFETSHKKKEVTQKDLLASLIPGLLIMAVVFYLEFSIFPWKNLNTESYLQYLLDLDTAKLVFPMFLAGIAYTYSSHKYYKAGVKLIFNSHLFVSILAFYTSYVLSV